MPSDERQPLLPVNNENEAGRLSKVKASLNDTLDPAKCKAPLTWQCVIAGAADAAAYSQTGTWVGFMTGNLTQLTISVSAVLMSIPNALPESLMRIALSSSAVLGFIFGSLLSAYIDGKYHGKHRGKLAITAICRAIVFAMVAPWLAIYGWKGQGGMAVLFLMAINMGSLAVNATKLGSTPFATTVVFTSTLASLFSDPMLPQGLSSASQVRARSIVALILGGAAAQIVMILTSRAMDHVDSLSSSDKQAHPIGSAFAVGLVAIFELFNAIAWMRVEA